MATKYGGQALAMLGSYGLSATSFAAGRSGGALGGGLISYLANLGLQIVGPSKAELRNQAVAELTRTPTFAAVQATTRSLPTPTTPDEGLARVQQVIAAMPAQARAQLAQAIAGLAQGSGQALRAFGRGLFAPEAREHGAGPRWPGPWPLSWDSPTLSPPKVLAMLGFPEALGALRTPPPAVPPSAPPSSIGPATPEPSALSSESPSPYTGARMYLNSLLGGGGGIDTSAGGGSGTFDFGGLLGGIAQGIGQVGAALLAPRPKYSYAMPGGGGTVSPWGTVLNAASPMGPEQAIGPGGGMVTSPWRGSHATPQPWMAQNPVTGSLVWFGPLGRPVLWSGDISRIKRVKKILGRAHRRLGGR